jgi:iron/zinc/copper transport system substrate-binding protein
MTMLHRPLNLRRAPRARAPRPFCDALIAIAMILALGDGCRRSASSTAAAPEPLTVFTSVYAMGDIVRQVGGQRVNLQWTVESGQPLDNIDITPERRNQFRSADLVVTRGAAEPWMLEGTGDAYRDRRIIRIDGLPGARHADPDLYLWLDPQIAMELVDVAALRLSALEPQSETYFKTNARKLKQQIQSATDTATTALAGQRGAPFLSLDRGFLALAQRFNLKEVKPPAGLSLREPSAYSVKMLRQTAVASGAGAVFANAETPPALLRDWQSRLEMPVLPLDALGSSAGSGRSGYLELLRYNLDQLVRGVTTSRPATKTATSP